MFPEFINIGGISIYSYGVMLATAFLTGLWLAYRRSKKVGIPPEVIVDTAIVVLIGAVVGAKLFYVIGHLPRYINNPGMLLDILRIGGVFQGGLIVAVALAILYLHWKKQPFWLVADIAAPSIAVGQAIGRVGCFAAGCCFGKTVDHRHLPWGVNFPPEAIAPFQGVFVFRHPTQLYESLLMALVFAALIVLWRFRKFDGQIFWTYVILYSIIRGGIVEWFRGDHGAVFAGLTGQQLLAAFTLLVGVIMIIFLWRRSRLSGGAQKTI